MHVVGATVAQAKLRAISFAMARESFSNRLAHPAASRLVTFAEAYISAEQP
jgi:hypothetical protein